jgi:hypothetical protein
LVSIAFCLHSIPPELYTAEPPLIVAQASHPVP